MSDLRFAPKGTIWVCAACGKTHKDRYGEDGEGDLGWDESCMLKAVLCEEDTYPWVAVDAAPGHGEGAPVADQLMEIRARLVEQRQDAAAEAVGMAVACLLAAPAEKPAKPEDGDV